VEKIEGFNSGGMDCFCAEIIRRLTIKKFKGSLKWFNNLKGSGFLAQARNADGNKRIEKGNAEFSQQAAR
jgi:hypothetical protein